MPGSNNNNSRATTPRTSKANDNLYQLKKMVNLQTKGFKSLADVIQQSNNFDDFKELFFQSDYISSITNNGTNLGGGSKNKPKPKK